MFSLIRKIPLHWQIISMMVIAVIVGLGTAPDSTALTVYEFLGTVFLNALKMLIVPLIFSSIVGGVAGLGNVKGFGRLGLKTAIYYAATSLIAILIGLTLVNIIQPGYVDGVPGKDLFPTSVETQAQLNDIGSRGLGDLVKIFERMVSPNIIDSATSNGNMLAIIFFSLLFGFFITQIKEDEYRDAIKNTIQGINEVMMLMTHWVMLFAPIGVFGLVAKTFANTGIEAFESLAKFFIAVMLGLAIHMFLVMPAILKFVGKINPKDHFKAMRDSLITAFTTSSSSATLPVTLECVEKKAGVSKQTSSFVLPLGATINMDGTALFECVAAMFIAQAYGVEMSFVQQFLVVSLALLTSIGVAGIPSASLVAIVVILNNIGVPDEGIGLLFAVDRILDMSRTAVNVFSDSCGAVIIARSEGEELYKNLT